MSQPAETLYVVLPDGSSHYEPCPVSLDDYPEGTRVYLTAGNAADFPLLDLAQLADFE